MSPYCSYTAHFSRQVIPKTFVTVDYIDYIHEDYHCEIRCKSVHGRYWVKWVKYNIQPFFASRLRPSSGPHDTAC